jgi:hypothetical protein
MQVLRKFFVALIFVLLLSVGGFLLLREYVLSTGTTVLKDSLRTLVKTARSGSYAEQCTSRSSSKIQTKEPVVQLRFISSTEYVVEVVCSEFAFDPILAEHGSLPQFVTKVPGTSGYVYDSEGRSGVALVVFAELERSLSALVGKNLSFVQKSTAMILDNVSISREAVESLETVSAGPVTSCEGYGFSCCQDGIQMGVGEQISGLVACKASCYSSCIARPVILAFNPNPFFESVTERVVRTHPGGTVEFVVVSDVIGSGATANFSFGDGETAQSSDFTQPTAHRYLCATGSCRYSTSVRVNNAQGVESSESVLSKITVIVD